MNFLQTVLLALLARVTVNKLLNYMGSGLALVTNLHQGRS
jgi:hypothetical protein